MDISQESKPIDTPQESKPIDIPQESKPMDISQESKPIDTPQESKPIDIPQESKPMNIQVSAADHMSMLLETIHQVGQFSAITFHVHRLARCGGHCDCICHSRQEFHSPQFLNNFLGALFVGYAGLPLTTSRCNRPRCTNQYSRTLQVSYTFPLWFLSRTVDIVAAMTFTGKPCFGMSVGNRVEFSSEKSIFQLARLGNIPGIIELFKARKASPNDLAIRGGYTALHVSDWLFIVSLIWLAKSTTVA
jgi:hypothetical protein